MKKIFIYLLILLSFCNLVYPATVNQIILGEKEGLIIEYPLYSTIKQGQHYYFDLHVFNKTDGILVSNETTDCYFHIHNLSGEIILSEKFGFDSISKDFDFYIAGGNFTELGVYSYMIRCNHSNHYGGEVSGLFEISKITEELTTDKAIMYSSFLLGLIIFFLLSSIGSFVINGKNEHDIFGNFVKVNFNKHIKNFLFFLSYFILILIVFMATKISYYYLIDSIVYSLIYWIQIILWVGLIPAFFIYLGFTIISILNDSKLSELKARNLKPF